MNNWPYVKTWPYVVCFPRITLTDTTFVAHIAVREIEQ